MNVSGWRGLPARIKGYVQRNAAYRLATRQIAWTVESPVVSFTFDDFPRSALLTGGKILIDHGGRGTFFASLGLMGRSSPSGELFSRTDLEQLLKEGHELGCHTFDHADPWTSSSRVFRESILRNREALLSLFPGRTFHSLAYPLTEPRPAIKRIAEAHFSCCRGGGRVLNSGEIDLNLLKSFFIDHKTREDAEYFVRLIERNQAAGGWLILSTHDIAANPSPYGCTPDFFETLVRHAVGSGSMIMTLVEVMAHLKVLPADSRSPGKA